MRLTVVGCAAAWTRRAHRASSCYLVEYHDRALVMDFGQGAFAALAKYRPPESVDGMLISHLHPDHYVDLVPLRHYLRYEASTEVALRSPADLRRRLDALMAQQDFLSELPGEALGPGEFTLAGLGVEARHVTHIDDSYAFRVSAPGGGPGLVYSGDCGVADDLLPLIRDGDTLLCEAANGTVPQPDRIHITAQDAARAAAASGAGRLILTHIQDRHAEDAARRAAAGLFGGELLVAHPGLRLEIGR